LLALHAAGTLALFAALTLPVVQRPDARPG